MQATLDTLNRLPREHFVSLLNGLYEHSPWIVEAVADLRPFTSREALIEATRQQVREASREAQLALVRAHPELGSRQLESLTAPSQDEQRNAGLTEGGEPLERLRTLNEAYRQRHGFPFVVAVAGMSPETILATLEERLPRDSDTELAESLTQISRIARLRLDRLLSE
ncbi:2-oxo-4-hydroxy-4-carboxy-5-ureidoimidazoline decarboxylase [Kushneria sinocarnis]|uniref:2-oxo-4-hydroxy-4-carboxy-5-ureidoimidazoline decarboxylase n=1 Tax=Kushneria sinocarnis TaxID=595502 RepID=A0A420WWI9_9GAMM|nr:2-oxo-4-hydroxy-4-carboxy-5-ureidoimidazoline decarboxylase [Kushneria sinocarnis]RKR03472.1 2-oxo-4-hydroxy-4-carboxy-5-ureidoimidazoline decarboxylase [Kushneria sinocarnis]